MKSIALALTMLVAAAGLAAQCPYQSLATQTIGSGCNTAPTGCCALPSAPTFLRVNLDPAVCELQLRLDALTGCCGVSAPIRMVSLGFQQIVLPVPLIGPGCTLHVAPVVTLSGSGALFPVRLPPGLPPMTVLGQGAVLHIDPFGPSVVTMTDALAMSLR